MYPRRPSSQRYGWKIETQDQYTASCQGGYHRITERVQPVWPHQNRLNHVV
jgi:hypothetical protein